MAIVLLLGLLFFFFPLTLQDPMGDSVEILVGDYHSLDGISDGSVGHNMYDIHCDLQSTV